MASHNKGHRSLALPSIQFDKQSYWNSDSSLTGGAPGDHTLSGLYPSTCSAWVTLPGVQDSSRHSSRGY